MLESKSSIKERAFVPDSIQPEKFTDPVVLDLIEKITVEVDPTLSHYQAVSEIVTKDSRSFQKRIDVTHGLGKERLSDEELEEKFRQMASKHMNDGHIRKLLDTCWRLEDLDDAGKLAKLMVFPGLKS